MIETALGADKLAFFVFQYRATIDTVLPVMDVIRLGYFSARIWIAVGALVLFHVHKVTNSSGGVKRECTES